VRDGERASESDGIDVVARVGVAGGELIDAIDAHRGGFAVGGDGIAAERGEPRAVVEVERAAGGDSKKSLWTSAALSSSTWRTGGSAR